MTKYIIKIKKAIAVVVFCSIALPVFPQLIINTVPTPAQLVQNVLLGGGVSVANITFVGSTTLPFYQFGEFSNGNTTNLGLTNGIVMSTCSANNIPNPNSVGTSDEISVASDIDLQTMAGGFNSYDAAVLEFDFMPMGNTISFRYVFASEEYSGFVNSNYNDVFGFFISGPGITGPYTGGAANIALVPATTLPVTINNVNNGFAMWGCPSGPCNNCLYYVENCNGTSIIFGGFTTILTATTPVQACQWYHIKLAVCDIADGLLDAAVFLEANSFSSTGVAIEYGYTNSGLSNNAIEGCSDGYISFTTDTPVSSPLTINYTVGGTATNGIDYNTIGNSVTISAGSDSAGVLIVPIFDGLPEGTETVTLIVNMPPCGNDTITITIIDNTPLVATCSNDQTICDGTQPVNISVTPTGAISPYTYNWNNGGGTGANAPVSPQFGTTTYTVTVTDACGATATDQVAITVNDCSIQATDTTICIGGSALIFVSASFGTSPYTYSWTGGLPSMAGPHSVSPITTTDYYVTVTDSSGIIETDTATVIVVTNPVVSLGHDTTFCTNTSSFTLNAGNPGCTYLWQNSSTNQTLTAANTGIYSVTVTNSSGCSGVDSILLCFGVLNSATVITPVSCFGGNDGAINLTVTSGTSPYTYNWSTGSLAEDISNLTAGTYLVTITDSLSCSSHYTAIVTQPTQLSTTVIGTNLACYQSGNGTINLTVSGGTPGYSYLWSNGTITEDLSGIQAGTYSVTVTDNNQCITTSSLAITQPTQINTSINPTNILCYGDNNGAANLTVNGGTPGYTYLWSNGAITENIINITSGLYSVTITDINGCTTTDSITITGVGQPLVVGISTTNASCYGLPNGSITATASGGTPAYSYQWNTGSTNSSITNASAGFYIVTVTDQNGCKKINSGEITQPNKLEVLLPSDFYICTNPSAIINASVTGGTPNYTYQWNTGDNTASITVTPGQTTTYGITVTDDNNCTSTDAITVNTYPELLLDIIINHDTICQGEPVMITPIITGGVGPPYTIFNQAGEIVVSPYILYPNETGTIELTVQDGCNKEAVDNVQITVLPLPEISFMSDITKGCQSLEVHFNEIHNYMSYTWDFDDINHVNLSLAHNPVHVFEDNGVYNVTVSVIDTNGCKNQLTIADMITVYPKPDAHFIAEPEIASIIKPIIQFTNLSTGANTFQWYFGDGDSSSIANPEHQYPNIRDYIVTLITLSQHNCSDTAKLQVTIRDEFTFYAPTAFSPDNDGINDNFRIYGLGIDKDGFMLMIYDRWGEPIFETNIFDTNTNRSEQWDGRAKNGKDIVPVGCYTWLCVFKDFKGNGHEKAGSVKIIR